MVNFLRTKFPHLGIERNRKIVPSPRGSMLELDVLIPAIGIAFEVQDFATHSRDENDVPGTWYGRPIVRKGPREHDEKRFLAKTLLDIDVFDVWQDDIESGSFRDTLKGILGPF